MWDIQLTRDLQYLIRQGTDLEVLVIAWFTRSLCTSIVIEIECVQKSLQATDDAHVKHHPNEQRDLTGLSWIPAISIGRWVLLGIQVCLLCYVLKGILSEHLQEDL